MNEREKEEFADKVLDYLATNNEDINKKILYKVLKINNDPEKKKIAGEKFDEYNTAKLNYNISRNRTIEKISPVLRGLIDEKSLDFDEDKNIVLLTRKNANIIENCVKDDDNYFSFAKTLYTYISNDKNIKTDYNALLPIIREIDRDNSTNVWRYKVNRDSLRRAVEFMQDSKNNFFDLLETGKIDLPDILYENSGDGMNSLSSKICKYLSEWIFHKDNYFINDKYVRHALLFYLDFYGINHDNLKSSKAVDGLSYNNLHKILQELREKSENLTKNEMDHIMWYCYKSFKA